MNQLHTCLRFIVLTNTLSAFILSSMKVIPSKLWRIIGKSWVIPDKYHTLMAEGFFFIKKDNYYFCNFQYVVQKLGNPSIYPFGSKGIPFNISTRAFPGGVCYYLILFWGATKHLTNHVSLEEWNGLITLFKIYYC